VRHSHSCECSDEKNQEVIHRDELQPAEEREKEKEATSEVTVELQEECKE